MARLDSGEVIHVPPQVSGRDVLEKCLIGEGRRVIGGEPIARIGESDRSASREAPIQHGPGLGEESAPFDNTDIGSQGDEAGLEEEQMPYAPVGSHFSWAGLSAEVTATRDRAVYASIIEPSWLSAFATVGAVSIAGTLIAATSIVSFFITGGILAPMAATVSLAVVASALRFAEYRLDPGGNSRP